MAQHFQLRKNETGSPMVEQLDMQGPGSFLVSPNARNETESPIKGSAIVDILGKKYAVNLTHKVKDYEDPEPSSTKWSYILNVYITGNTPVATADIKSQDIAYCRASRGKTVYDINGFATQTLILSKAYNNYTNLMNTVGDFTGTHYGESYGNGALMDLFEFTMYYKYATTDGTTVIPPVDDGTPASNKARIPCRPDPSPAPNWITGQRLMYIIRYDKYNSGTSGAYTSDQRVFGTWDDFIAFWDAIHTNPEYRDATFSFLLRGTIAFNVSLSPRGDSDNGNMTINETSNGKGIGIHGAKPLYFRVSQQEGKTIYGASVIPATAAMLDTQGGYWSFSDLTVAQMYNYRLSRESDLKTYNYTPKFRIKSSSSYYARLIQVITGGSVIIYPDNHDVSFQYQYLGQPFILKIFKEDANGIVKSYMRPYKSEYWKDQGQILGAQNFNPIQYDEYDGEFHYLHIRDTGWKGFLSGPMSGNLGLCGFQLIPITLYNWAGDQLYVEDDIDGEGGVGTKGVNYVNRYNNYQSAIGGADTPGQNSTDVYKAAFLKWPNADGNNEPDHICTTGIVESVPSKMGKNWEHYHQNNGNWSYIDRVMFLPVLWTQLRLEESADLRNYLASPRFGSYLLSPWANDAESNPEAIYRIQINGLNIQIQ